MAHKTLAGQRDDELCFVQFMHPGQEHRPDHECYKTWNRDLHRRKFLVNPGRCIRQRKARKGELVFWAEWEPESEVACRVARPLPQYPRFVYRPCYVVPESYKGLQNTDPFVFGGFFYGNCRQHKNDKPTRLSNLAPGSVILFGSCLGGTFVLDTLFVVRDSVLYNCAHYSSVPKERIPDGYREVVLDPLCLSGRSRGEGCVPQKGRQYRLYFGATYEERYEGMFSFFPCVPHAKACESFKRPVIEMPDLITPTLRMGFRLNYVLTPARIYNLWERVVRQVLRQRRTDPVGPNHKLWLGIEAEMPERRLPKQCKKA